MSRFPLTLGGITFDQDPFEGPNGKQGGLGDLGSHQNAVVHEFPGGIMSAQLYGSFPKVISWKGKLFGSQAEGRSFQLQALVDNGELVTLTYKQWSFDGYVEDYKCHVLGPYEIEFDISFKPLANNTAGSGGNQQANNDPFAQTVSNANSTMQQQFSAPAIGATLPPLVQSGSQSLSQAINQALQQTGGSVATMQPAVLTNLLNQIGSLQDLLSPLIAGDDLQVGSAAADLNSTLGILRTAFSNTTTQIVTTLKVLNPNLFQLAQQYYGDPALYWVIGDANGFIDPLPETDGPISLVIPIKPQLPVTLNETVVYGSTAA